MNSIFQELLNGVSLHTIFSILGLLLTFTGIDIPKDILRDVESTVATISSNQEYVSTTTNQATKTLPTKISNTKVPAAKPSSKSSFISTPSVTEENSSTSSIQVIEGEDAASTEIVQSITFRVTDVVDGDTIKVTDGNVTETIRIIGINTPETVAPNRPVECFGKQASNKAKELLLGRQVELKNDTTQDNRDKYSRLLRYVFVDGVDYGLEMIRGGYAYEYTYHLPYVYQKEYKEAQMYARNNNEGLWSSGTCSGVK